jgi:hypothetical protein
MLALTDQQLDVVRTAGAQLPHRLRAAFLQKLAAQIDDRDIGDGELHRLAHTIVQSLAPHQPPHGGNETTEIIRGFGVTP